MNKQIFSIKNSASLAPEKLPEVQTKALYKKYIPAILARRCSQLSKMALTTSAQALENNTIDYAIFCSQHGELECALSLLKDLSHGELLSPARFVRSVHNTAAGLFSITHKMQQNMTSISAGKNSFLMGMVDALAWLKLHPDDRILLTAFDDHIPSEYQSLNIKNDDQYAAAFIISSKDQHIPTIAATMCNTPDNHRSGDDLPDALAFLNWLGSSSKKSLTQGAGQTTMTWERLSS